MAVLQFGIIYFAAIKHFYIFYASIKERGAEHVKDIEGKKQKKSVLFKHKLTDHKNENVKFQMTVTNKFKAPLLDKQTKP